MLSALLDTIGALAILASVAAKITMIRHMHEPDDIVRAGHDQPAPVASSGKHAG
ncbi:hypothetical protein [Paraburkholderia sp.]|uniref:hypothetical protein n=1 Tax=Paraburkholderia sp. TaxID=1926495 RepID=UPI00257D4301|nr:hypothetical protein [Paraburkholderia sp.]